MGEGTGKTVLPHVSAQQEGWLASDFSNLVLLFWLFNLLRKRFSDWEEKTSSHVLSFKYARNENRPQFFSEEKKKSALLSEPFGTPPRGCRPHKIVWTRVYIFIDGAVWYEWLVSIQCSCFLWNWIISKGPFAIHLFTRQITFLKWEREVWSRQFPTQHTVWCRPAETWHVAVFQVHWTPLWLFHFSVHPSSFPPPFLLCLHLSSLLSLRVLTHC